MATTLTAGGVARIVAPPPPLNANRASLRHTVLSAVERGAGEVVLVFGPLIYLDATDVGLLLALQRELRQRFGAKMVLDGLNQDMRRHLAQLQIADLFHFSDPQPAPARTE